jgi:hypothetical protein
VNDDSLQVDATQPAWPRARVPALEGARNFRDWVVIAATMVAQLNGICCFDPVVFAGSPQAIEDS